MVGIVSFRLTSCVYVDGDGNIETTLNFGKKRAGDMMVVVVDVTVY